MLFEKLNNLLREAISSDNKLIKNCIWPIKSFVEEYQVINNINIEPDDQIILEAFEIYKKKLYNAIILLSKGKSSNKLIQEYKKKIKFFEDIENSYLPLTKDVNLHS